MKLQTKLLIVTVVILGASYAYWFTDWFAEKKIQIKYRSLPGRGKPGTVEPVMFYLVPKAHMLTSIRVVSLDEAATNKYPHALWHVVPASNAVLVTDFIYGEPPPGMTAKIAGVTPEPLDIHGNYRIYLETAKLKGEKDFQPRASSGR